MIRAAIDADAPGIVALIAACWAEYPGCVMDDAEVPELRALGTHYAAKGGRAWVAERDGAIVGLVGVAPLNAGAWEIGKMYVSSGARGTGLAQALLATAEDHARAGCAAELRLWSDTRFTRAHRFYEAASYVSAGPIRALHDVSNSIEFAYAKPVAGCVVRRLDAAGAASAERRLAAILKACVDGGASVSYLPPLDIEVARGFARKTASGVALGGRVLLVAWLDGVLVGSVQLDLATPPNQPHRTELQKLLVLPHVRRRGVARALMLAADAEAVNEGRTLMTLDTRADDAAEPLYRSLGWIEAGRIPGYALNPDGTAHATVLFYRLV